MFITALFFINLHPHYCASLVYFFMASPTLKFYYYRIHFLFPLCVLQRYFVLCWLRYTCPLVLLPCVLGPIGLLWLSFLFKKTDLKKGGPTCGICTSFRICLVNTSTGGEGGGGLVCLPESTGYLQTRPYVVYSISHRKNWGYSTVSNFIQDDWFLCKPVDFLLILKSTYVDIYSKDKFLLVLNALVSM